MNESMLREVAATTGGAFFREEDLHKLPETIRLKTEHVQSPLEVELWSSPLYFLLLLGVVTAEWVCVNFRISNECCHHRTTRGTQFAVQPSALLLGKLAALRRRHVAVAVLTGVAMIAAVSIELGALAMFFDWWLNLPYGLRLLSLIVQLAVFAFILLKMVVHPLLRQPDDDDSRSWWNAPALVPRTPHRRDSTDPLA